MPALALGELLARFVQLLSWMVNPLTQFLQGTTLFSRQNGGAQPRFANLGPQDGAGALVASHEQGRFEGVVPEGRPRGEMAVHELEVEPPRGHPIMQNAARIRKALKAEKLPTNASGVEVYVLGENPLAENPNVRDHGPAIARTIAGPAGLAHNAEVQLLNPVPRAPSPAAGKNLGLKDSTRAVVQLMANDTLALGDEVRRLRSRLPEPSDAKTRIATISWGDSPATAAVAIADAGLEEGNDGQLVRDVNAERMKQGLPPLDVRSEKDRATVRGRVLLESLELLKTPEGRAPLQQARITAGAEVLKAREAGIITFAAAGNDHHPKLPEDLIPATRLTHADTPGVITVGATMIGDPKSNADDRMWDHSSGGAQIAAPGYALPVSKRQSHIKDPQIRKLLDDFGVQERLYEPDNAVGTSFAAPYAASVVALMIKANPKITPNQIESILLSREVAKDIPGTSRDGRGAIDEVAAVRLAKAAGS